MTIIQAYLLGVMTVLTPSMLVMAVLLTCAADREREHDRG